MLSKNCRRLLPIVSRRRNVNVHVNVNRYLSSVADSVDVNVVSVESAPIDTEEPRRLPTRHSRYNPPPVAPAATLDDSSENILKSISGTLFAYDSTNLHQTKSEEFLEALSACFSLQQKVEYLLRGYSSLLHGTMVRRPDDVDLTGSVDVDADETIQKMVELIHRVELEGDTYVQLRSKYRSQVARVSQEDENPTSDSNEDKDDADDDDDDNNDSSDSSNADAWKLSQLVVNFGAPPGPTTAMYDLALDAIAKSIPHSPDPATLLRTSRELYLKVLERHDLDVKAGTDELNPSSCPSTCTFNAAIRAAARVKATNDEVRDIAFENAFFAFDAMGHHNVVHRNSATYRFMLDVMRSHFPVGEMRGNIACGMWKKCVVDKVVDKEVIQSMICLSNEGSHGEDFDQWWKNLEVQYDEGNKNGFGFPIVWGKNKKIRRFDMRHHVY